MRVRDLSGLRLEVALFEYTNFYVRFGLGRDFDSDHPGWQSYLAGLRDTADERTWTYRFYLREPEIRTAPPVVATFGCFSYALQANGHVRLHFRNAEQQHAPLGVSRVGSRRAELSALFSHLESRVSEETPVVGASWLYNLQAYRRLFPPAYVSSAHALRGRFRSMPLWGQFLDRYGRVGAPVAQRFLDALARCSHAREVGDCFPLQVLTVSAPAKEFYEFYGVRASQRAQ